FRRLRRLRLRLRRPVFRRGVRHRDLQRRRRQRRQQLHGLRRLRLPEVAPPDGLRRQCGDLRGRHRQRWRRLHRLQRQRLSLLHGQQPLLGSHLPALSQQLSPSNEPQQDRVRPSRHGTMVDGARDSSGSRASPFGNDAPEDELKARDAIVSLDKARVWHPYTPMRQYVEETEPLVIERAEGARIFDVDGKSYLDGNASWWVALLGHRHPRLLRALREQSERMCHVSLAGITHEPAARLAEELVAVAPAGLSRVFFSDDGSTAVEVALKLALQLWFNRGRPEKKRLLAL